MSYSEKVQSDNENKINENLDEKSSIDYEQDSFTELRKMLIDCKSEILLQTFIDQEIDDDFLLRLDIHNAEEWNQVSELLPTIGAKGRFKKVLRQFQVNN